MKIVTFLNEIVIFMYYFWKKDLLLLANNKIPQFVWYHSIYFQYLRIRKIVSWGYEISLCVYESKSEIMCTLGCPVFNYFFFIFTSNSLFLVVLSINIKTFQEWLPKKFPSGGASRPNFCRSWKFDFFMLIQKWDLSPFSPFFKGSFSK